MRAPDHGLRCRAALGLGGVAVVLSLAGCAGTSTPAAQATPAPSAAAASSVASSVASSAESSRAAAQYASNTPPSAAQMVCSDEILRQVMGALALTSVPAPESRWADHVYTCTYRLPMGSLVLSVAVAPSDAAAADQLQAMRRQDGATAAEPGLGQQAFSAPNGTILAAKDNMVLRVDASGLPDRLGPTHEPRIGLTRILAAAVFNCWTGE